MWRAGQAIVYIQTVGLLRVCRVQLGMHWLWQSLQMPRGGVDGVDTEQAVRSALTQEFLHRSAGFHGVISEVGLRIEYVVALLIAEVFPTVL